MARNSSKSTTPRGSQGPDPALKRRTAKSDDASEDLIHVIRKGVRCDTERRGHKTPHGRSPLKIVVDASEGFIPLWEKETILRWTFRESSLQVFENPAGAATAIEELLGEAILLWGDAAPVKFAHRDDAWDFEIIVRNADECDLSGCVLASAFFPDAGRHELAIYPKLFEQSREEQIETLAHEIGHVFGLRHFFAQISETEWPSEIFGKHQKFSIMNYNENSQLTEDDKSDLKALYALAWSGQLPDINGTPVRLVNAFHTNGLPAEEVFLMKPAVEGHPAFRRTLR